MKISYNYSLTLINNLPKCVNLFYISEKHMFISEPYYATTNHNGMWNLWSKCSAQCRGGSKYRVRNCESGSTNCQTAKQFCNTDDYVPEPELRGILASSNNYLGRNSVPELTIKISCPHNIACNVEFFFV